MKRTFKESLIFKMAIITYINIVIANGNIYFDYY